MVARVLIVLTIVFRGSLSQFCNTAERFPNYIVSSCEGPDIF